MIENNTKTQSRKKFIGAGITAAALLTAFKFFVPQKKKAVETNKVKMLTQDGKLVEVDVVNKPPQGKKITNEQLKNWIHNNNQNPV